MIDIAHVDRPVYIGAMRANPGSKRAGVPAARERILTVAHDLFYRDGIRATGVDRLIAEAQVTKVTFYRHFPSKDDLVVAFLRYRHERWMSWFVDALYRHRAAQKPADRERNPLASLYLTIEEWINEPAFRGCAFINAVAELGEGAPGVIEIAAAHKQDMANAIVPLLTPSPAAAAVAHAAALAVDGAIVRAQAGMRSKTVALAALRDILDALDHAAFGRNRPNAENVIDFKV